MLFKVSESVLVSIIVICFVSDVYCDVPLIFEMDNYPNCRQEQNIYCQVSALLTTTNDSSREWQLIQSTKNDYRKFGRNRIERGVCVPKYLNNKQELIHKYVVERLDKSMENASLKTNIDFLSCKQNNIILKKNDFIFATCFALYLILIAMVTKYDLNLRKMDSEKKDKKGNPVLLCFSIISNYESMKAPINNTLYQRLKSIQGLRTYFMCLVVLGHTFLNYTSAFMQNPKKFEDFFNTQWILFFNLGMYLVQPFFLITGFLIASHILFVIEQDKQFSSLKLLLAILNRVFRLWPALIVCILIHKSQFPIYYLNDGAFPTVLQFDNNACKNHWWSTLFFLTNLKEPKKMCNAATWYLSADFHLFVFSILAFYVIEKFKLPKIRSFSALFVALLVMQAYRMYIDDLGHMYEMKPDNFRLLQLLQHSKVLDVWYFSTLSNAPSYMLGLLFGNIFYKYKDTNYKPSLVIKIIWSATFLGLPFLSVYLSGLDYTGVNPLIVALLGSGLKPLFSLGFGIGILGMAMNFGGYLQRICEWRFAEIISRVTYSVYLYHIAIVFELFLRSQGYIDFSMQQAFLTSFGNILKCFAIGTLMYLIVESPFTRLQKMSIEKLTTMYKTESIRKED